MSRGTQLAVRVHARARGGRLERDGPALRPRVRAPPAGGRAGAAVIRVVARRATVAPSPVAIVSGAAARHKLAGIDRQDALPAPAA